MPHSKPNSVLIAEVSNLRYANKKLASKATSLESQLESSRIYVRSPETTTRTNANSIIWT